MITAIFVVFLLLILDAGDPGAALVQGATALGVATSAMETEGLAIAGLVEEAAVEVAEEAAVPANTIISTDSNMNPLWGGSSPQCCEAS